MPATFFTQSTRTITWVSSLNGLLKAVKDSFCFISRGTRSQILAAKYEIVSIPINTDFTWGLLIT